MRCLSLRRDVNSNANGVAEGEDFQVGESPIEAVGRLGAGRSLAPRRATCTFDDGSPVSKVLRGYFLQKSSKNVDLQVH